MSEYNTQIQKVTVTCTDNGRQVTATVDEYKPKQFMRVIMAEQKIVLTYNPDFGQVYVGNSFGMEFTASDRDLHND
jgi:hypothetical protein